MKIPPNIQTIFVLLLAGANASALFAEEKIVVLDDVSVEAESDETLVQDGYVAESGQQATKVDTPILLIPQAMTVVTQDQLEDQAPRTINESLTYASATNPYSFGYDNRFDAFSVRGFPLYYDGVFRDGIRQYNAPTALYKNEPYGLEALALLKGPSSSLYGASGAGGIMNLVSKRPKDEYFNELRLSTGEHSRAEAAFDFSGPFKTNDAVRYRLTGLFRDSDTHLDGFDDDKFYLAPSLSVDIGDNTTMTFLGEWSKSKTGGVAGFYNPSPGQVSNLYNGDPDYNDFTQDQWRIGYEIESQLSDYLIFRQNARLSQVDVDLTYSGWYPTGTPAGLARYWGHYKEDMRATTMDTMLQVNVDTGPVSHEIIGGIDLTRSHYDSASALGYVSIADTAAQTPAFAGSLNMDQVGVYLHDQMSVDAWTIFASARFDKVKVDGKNAASALYEQEDSGSSARLGVSYEFDNGLSLYGNVSTSFLPVPQLVYDDINSPATRPGRPTEAVQKEIGIKYQIPGTNSLLSANYFDIEATDQLILDATAGVNKARQVNMDSRGIELEAMIDFDNGWSTIGSFTHQDVKFADDDANFAGNAVNSVPKNTAALWVHYDIESGPARGLGIGAGARYVGSSYGNDANTIENDAQTYFDISLDYEFPQAKGLSAQLNIKNVFDSEKVTCASSNCYRSEGRFIGASLTKQF